MTQRIPSLDVTQIEPSLLDLAAYRRSGKPQPFNIYRTLANHPQMTKQWLFFADALRFEARLPGRDRELLILRTGFNCQCEYEWGQHLPYARANDVSEREIVALCQPIEVHDWIPQERSLLRAADELHETSNLSESTWSELSRQYSVEELIEIPMVVGQYHLVAYLLNGLRVVTDEGLEEFPQIE